MIITITYYNIKTNKMFIKNSRVKIGQNLYVLEFINAVQLKTWPNTGKNPCQKKQG